MLNLLTPQDSDIIPKSSKKNRLIHRESATPKSTHGKQLRFLRHKTRDRNEGASEVIFPITPELKKILDKYGNKPELGKRVFPILSESITPEKEVWSFRNTIATYESTWLSYHYQQISF